MTETKDKRNELLADMILRCRERRALTQAGFANEAGIGRATLSRIEQGRLFPGATIRRKIAATIGISPEDLWEEVNERHHEQHPEDQPTAGAGASS